MEIPENIRDSVITDGKAFLQVLFEEYMNY
jgi:hypothetical protein